MPCAAGPDGHASFRLTRQQHGLPDEKDVRDMSGREGTLRPSQIGARCKRAVAYGMVLLCGQYDLADHVTPLDHRMGLLQRIGVDALQALRQRVPQYAAVH